MTSSRNVNSALRFAVDPGNDLGILFLGEEFTDVKKAPPRGEIQWMFPVVGGHGASVVPTACGVDEPGRRDVSGIM